MDGPPVVTLDDPRAAGRPADVLDADGAGRTARRLLAAGLGLVVLLLVLSLAGQVRERRVSIAEQRRLDGVVALALTERFGFVDAVAARPSTRAALLAVDVELRNDGPRPVRVQRATVGGFELRGDVGLGPGRVADLQLVRTVTCPAGAVPPSLDPVAQGLRVQVLTRAGLRSTLVSPGALVLDRLRAAARRACGFVPVERAVQVTVRMAVREVRGLVLSVALRNSSVRPLRLLELRLATGLRVATGPRLPRPVPPGHLGGAAFDRFEVGVVPDCAAAPRSASGRLLPLPGPVLGVVVGDGDARAGPLAPRYDDLGPVRIAYARACS